ncbi:MAG TPA: lytic murein transglycosylase [Gaiellaceae bacterium]|jgi:murein DD-endopeptidase MepM/ murein hydrolase activator NlpD|nr:lytic murein transglycosylase [Gaiellaceae bacterium]
MRRLAPLALVLGLALLAGTAHADTFAVLPETQTSPFVLPTLTPNAAGSVALPAQLATPPASPAQLSYTQLLGLWQRAGAMYGIPWQVLAAINKVESNFGRNMGPSSAGAIGWMQFMPDTWLRWGVDANGDGVADPWNPDDAIFSAARYLAAAGGANDISRSVYAYNHADWYVNEVLGLAGIYGSDSTVAFSLDRMQQSLEAARTAVVDASDQLVAAKTQVRADGKVAARWLAAANAAPLLSDRLVLEERAGLAAGRRNAAAQLVAERTRALASAQGALDRAEQQSAAASFAPATSQLFGAPSYSSGYVFPVGGGPGVVFASHSHHDYPAVDIAAPLGSPLYALANAVVQRAWTTPDPACGIGFTIQAFDGQVWTYCHLSVLDPAVVPGASLQAGQPVGLVGATGDATGPHLHLQLQPASVWPQQEAWFQSFAGSAFTWTDSAPTGGLAAVRTPALVGGAPAAQSGPVFEVVTAPDPSNGVVYFSRARS